MPFVPFLLISNHIKKTQTILTHNATLTGQLGKILDRKLSMAVQSISHYLTNRIPSVHLKNCLIYTQHQFHILLLFDNFDCFLQYRCLVLDMWLNHQLFQHRTNTVHKRCNYSFRRALFRLLRFH